jgi:hypothetical protein
VLNPSLRRLACHFLLEFQIPFHVY